MEFLLNLPVVANAPPVTRKTEMKHKDDDVPSFSDALEKANKKKDADEAELAAASQAASQQAVQPQQQENKPAPKDGQDSEEPSGEGKVDAVAAEAGSQAGKGQIQAVFAEVEKAETLGVENLAQGEVKTAAVLPETPAVEAAEAETAAVDAKATGTPVKADAEAVIPVDMTPVETEVQTKPVEGAVAQADGKPVDAPVKFNTADAAVQTAGSEELEQSLSQKVVSELGEKNEAPEVQTENNLQVAQAIHGAKLSNVEGSSGELARTAEARSPQVVSQISQGIETMVKSGNNSLHLQLYPENLGKIDLRLVMSENGMRVMLNADASTTGSMLERHLPELRQALVDAGVNISGLTVGSGSTQGQTQTFDQWQNPSKKSTYQVRGVTRLQPEPVEVEPAVRSRISSKVDYRV